MGFTEELYRKYSAEMRMNTHAAPVDGELFSAVAVEKLRKYTCLAARNGDEITGAIFYRLDTVDGKTVCEIPVYGYFAASLTLLEKLFQAVAQTAMQRGLPCHFSVSLYAHDEEVIRLFNFMQFGITRERGVRCIPAYEGSEHEIQLISKEELAGFWDEVWAMTEGIVEQLRSSPVFYRGEEFTEDRYWRFYTAETTRVFGAFVDGQLVGIIETNDEEDELVCHDHWSVNVGEAFLLPQYRGSGMAEALLRYAESYEAERGAEYAWVEHGTANPLARHFWNRYFESWCYTLERDVEQL